MLEMSSHLKAPCCTLLKASWQDRFGIRRRHVRRYQTAALPRHRCQCRGNKPPGSPSESKASPHSQKLPKQADSESRHKEGISDNEEQARQEAAAAAFTAVLAKLQKAAVPSYRERHPFKWDLKQLGPTIPFKTGLPGTFAMVAGYWLHIDPFGHLHWSLPDAVTGLKWAVPFLALDACLMLPSFSSSGGKRERKAGQGRGSVQDQLGAALPWTTQQERPPNSSSAGKAQEAQPAKNAGEEVELQELKDLLVRSAAEVAFKRYKASQTSSSDSKNSPEANLPDRQKDSSHASTSAAAASHGEKSFDSLRQTVEDRMHSQVLSTPASLSGALDSWQRLSVSRNPMQKHLLVSELVCILLQQLTTQMVDMAIVLTCLAGWVTDRFYEAGMEDVMPFIGHQPLSTPEAGQWTAVAMLAGFAIGINLLVDLQTIGTLERLESEPPFSAARAQASEDKQQTAGGQLLAGMSAKVAELRVTTAIKIARSTATAVLYGGSFIMTGNLLAPLVASVTRLVFLSLERRAQHRRFLTKFQGQVQSLQHALVPSLPGNIFED